MINHKIRVSPDGVALPGSLGWAPGWPSGPRRWARGLSSGFRLPVGAGDPLPREGRAGSNPAPGATPTPLYPHYRLLDTPLYMGAGGERGAGVPEPGQRGRAQDPLA